MIWSQCQAGSAQRWTFTTTQTIVRDGGTVGCAAVTSATAGTTVTVQNCDSNLLTQRWLYDDQARLRVLAAPQLCIWVGAIPNSGNTLTLKDCGWNDTSYQWNATGEGQGAGSPAGGCVGTHVSG